MSGIINFLSAVKSALRAAYAPIPKSGLDNFIKFHNPQSQEQLDHVLVQYDEMRRLESRLIARGDYHAAQMIVRTYYV
jgi:hypothetical protein